MDHEVNMFPRYIDKPRLIGIFEMDEFFLAFFLMAAILAISLAFPNIKSLYVMVTAIAAGIGSATIYKKFKNNRPDGFTMQRAYRSGIFSPTDDKKALLKYKYLRRLKRMIPYGFTKVFYN